MSVEYERLIRRTFIPFYLDDQANRRRILMQLNKGEEVHSLREFLFFDNKGPIHKRQPDELVNLAGYLGLVSNAVINPTPRPSETFCILVTPCTRSQSHQEIALSSGGFGSGCHRNTIICGSDSTRCCSSDNRRANSATSSRCAPRRRWHRPPGVYPARVVARGHAAPGAARVESVAILHSSCHWCTACESETMGPPA